MAAPSSSSGSQLWVDKYAPQTLSQLCYPVVANQLKAWLENFETITLKDPKKHRGALLSGPPGVGKTTTVHLVAAALHLTVVEFNASDFRSKKSLHERVSMMVNNKTLQGDGRQYVKVVLLMDEVDGCDIGGVGEVIQMLKVTQVPILCTANDRWHPKLRSLMNHVEDMRFSRPPCNIVANYLCDRVLAREGVTVPKPLLQDIIKQSGSDIRHMISNVQLWCIDQKTLSATELASCAVQSQKNSEAGLFEAAESFLLQGTSRGRPHSVEELERLYYNADLIDMFVQENYIHFNPEGGSAGGATSCAAAVPTWLGAVQEASESISRGDAAHRIMYIDQNWSVSRAYVLYSSIFPCAFTRGKYESFCTGQQVFFDRQRPVKFPTWLGHNSTAGKNRRLLQCISKQASHPATGASASPSDFMTDYIPLGFAPQLSRPLVAASAGQVPAPEAIESVLSVMGQYQLGRDDWDFILATSSCSPAAAAAKPVIATAVKSAFTRAFNKKYAGQGGYMKAAMKNVGTEDAGESLEGAGDDDEEQQQQAKKKVKSELDSIPGLVKTKTTAAGGAKGGTAGTGRKKAADGDKPKPKSKPKPKKASKRTRGDESESSAEEDDD